MSVLIALYLSPSWAFAPVEMQGVSLEPGRLQYQNLEEQGRLLAGPQWRRFVSTDGKGWNARFDEATGTPRWMWGRGIPLPVDSREALVQSLRALLERHEALLGFRAEDLSLARANYVERVDTWYIEFDTLRDGLRTYRGGISARVKHGNLVYLKVATAPRAPVTGALALSAEEAVQRAIAQGPAPEAHHTERTAEPILLERKTAAGHELRKTWMVRTRTGGPLAPSDPVGLWVSFVDGRTGELLNVHNEVRFATIEARHHQRTLDGSPLVTSGVPYAYVANNQGYTVTDEFGDYTLGGGGPYATELNGEYVSVNNAAGQEGYLSEGDGDMTWTTSDATQAEIDSYIFLHHVKRWGEETAPEVPWVQGPIASYVNINDVCNAYFDGSSVNFFDDGYGCNNTGQIADVNYHEWGHGFHAYSLQAGTFDGSLSEGAGDTVSFLLTQDRYIAPFFQTNGNAIRDVGPDRVYPDDFVYNDYYVHYNGLIFGGAMWDLLNLLKDAEGDEQGTAITSEIFAGLLKGGPEIPDSYYEALVADDDDGDLGNGTPHICQIQDAFARHGLGEGASTGGGGVIVTHEPLETMPAGQDFPVSLELVSLGAGCEAVGAETATVHYRVKGEGGWQQQPLNTAGLSIEGVIPEQPEYSIVEYYITGESDDGAAFSAPSGGRINPFTFFVGDALKIRCDDFEDSDGGYTHTLLSGEAEEGADDWQWGSPSGAGGDPSQAASGVRVWGNDLGFDGYNGQYQPGKGNRLESPRLKTRHYTDVFLSYRRWLQIEDATYDQAIITADDEVVWSNWQGDEDDHHLDGQWVTHVVDLKGIADQGGVRIGFELHSDGGLEFGGWTIDDVCLMAPATPDNRLGITDFEVEEEDAIHAILTWTHPKHRPVESVRVVRRTDRFPEDHEDGDIAWEDDDPSPGDKVEIEDENGWAGTTYYAVFASDGDNWLSWVVEDWNAASIELEGGAVDDEWWNHDETAEEVGSKVPLPGCGCATNSGLAQGSAWSVPLLLAAVLARRRSSPI